MRRASKDLVVIPVYNEADKIDKVLASVRKVLRGMRVDVAVVDDGSDDGSGERARRTEGVAVLTHGSNRGYGRALGTGFGYATGGDYARLVTLDCDEQHQPADIPAFFEELGELDVLSGSRYLRSTASSPLAPPPDRVAVNRTITAEINKLTGWSLTDAFCGMKAYRVGALSGMPVREDGYAMPLEFWVRAWKRGLRVGEKAVDLIYNSSSRSFGEILDDPQARLGYYREVIKRSLNEEEG